MSLNSLQDDMSRRASSMAAMANSSTNPQEIQAIQKSLIDGVKNGSIQSYVGIPLIQELTNKLTEAKAQMAQSMAGIQQPQQGQQAPPPIAEQVMQQAAQESQGLESLPSNLPQEYAGGGIIAFEHGGEVQRFNEGLLVDENYPDSYYRRSAALAQLDPKSLESYVQQYKALMPAKGATQTEYEEYLRKRSGDSEATKKQDLNLALAQFGLNLAAGKSPRALENLGEAGIKTLPAVQEAYKQRRLADETSLRGRAELERMARAEEIDALKGGLGIFGDERKIEAAAANAELQRKNAIDVARAQKEGKVPTDLMQFINDDVRNELQKGSTKTVEALRVEAYAKAPMLLIKKDIAGMQVGATLTGQNVQAGIAEENRGVTKKGQILDAQTFGIREWNDLSPRDISKKEFKAATKKDQENKANGIKSDLAGDVRRRWIQENTPGAVPAPEKVVVPPPPPPPKGAAPSISSVQGAPAGSKIGAYTTKGWEVKDKNGTLLGYTRSN